MAKARRSKSARTNSARSRPSRREPARSEPARPGPEPAGAEPTAEAVGEPTAEAKPAAEPDTAATPAAGEVTNAGFVRTDFSRGEAITGLVWLGLGALVSLLLEVVYLGVRLPLPGGSDIAFPVTIIIAWWFNGVLTRTATLWVKDSRSVGGLMVRISPLAVWLLGYLVLMFGVVVTGDQMVGNNIPSMLLLLAGVAGGVWPIVDSK